MLSTFWVQFLIRISGVLILIYCVACGGQQEKNNLEQIDLYRIKTGKSTIGIMSAPSKKILAYTLENNQYILQAGNYEMIPRIHQRFGKCVQLGGKLLNRGFFLHCGNLVVNSRGCILIADSVVSTSKILRCRPALDSLYDVTKKQKTFLNIIER
jgi:Family of unknown function (DUF5675)